MDSVNTYLTKDALKSIALSVQDALVPDIFLNLMQLNETTVTTVVDFEETLTVVNEWCSIFANVIINYPANSSIPLKIFVPFVHE
jgi:hypothetical protein